MKTYLLIPACVLLVLLGLGFSEGDGGRAWAQQSNPEDGEAASAEPVDAEEPAAPVAITSSEIAGRATSAISLLTDLRKTADPQPQIEEISTALPELVTNIEQLRDDPINAQPEGQALFLLEDARLQWERLETRLGKWGQTLGERAQALEQARMQVGNLQQTWILTKTEAASEERPAAVTDQIQAVLVQINETDQKLQARQDTVLTLQNQISEQVIAIGVQTDLLGAAQEVEFENVLQRDRPPIWGVGDLQFPTIRDQFQNSWNRVTSGVELFWESYRNRFLWQLALFGALSAAIALLHRQAIRYRDEDQNIQAATRVLSHPLLAAGLLTLLFSGRLYPAAPLVIQQLIPAFALPFAARLAPSLVPRSLLRPLYGLFVLSLVSILQNVFFDQDPLRRTILMAIAIAAVSGVVWLRRRTRLKNLLAWPRVSSAVVRWGGLLFAVAVVTNVLGFVSLAELITYATIESAFIAFILLAGARIIEALVMVGLRIRSVQSLATIRYHREELERWIIRIVRIAAVVLWLVATLKLFQIYRPVWDRTNEWLTRSWQIGSLNITLINIVLFFVVLSITRYIAKVVRRLLEEDILPRARVESGVGATISTLVNYAILTLGILLALAAAGIELQQFTLLVSALGVGIGFGLQGVVNNFVSGLILIFERVIRRGDKVQIGTLIGGVKHIGMRATTLRTFEGADVIVPNADFTSNQVINWTLADRRRRITIKVGVAYGTDPVKVQELLVGIAQEHDKVLENPEPFSLFQGFGESSLDFELRFWVADYDNWIHIASKVTVAVNAALVEAGIVIPFPQRDIHIAQVTPRTPGPETEPKSESEPEPEPGIELGEAPNDSD